jgi:hypothetical protein
MTRRDATTTTGSTNGEEEHHHDGNGDAAVLLMTQCIPLPHNLLFVIENTKDPAERDSRINLTFRDQHPSLIFSLKPCRTRARATETTVLSLDKAPRVRRGRRHGCGEEAERLLVAFGTENYESEFDGFRPGSLRCFGTTASVCWHFFGTSLRCVTISSGCVRFFFCCL